MVDSPIPNRPRLLSKLWELRLSRFASVIRSRNKTRRRLYTVMVVMPGDVKGPTQMVNGQTVVGVMGVLGRVYVEFATCYSNH